MPQPTKIFTFTVGPDGKFTYDPPGDWAYVHTDTIRFQTESGPFTLKTVPDPPIPVADFNPLGSPLTSVPYDGVHHADTTVTDSLSELDRKTLILGNKSTDHPEGFVGHYRYDIQVSVNGKTFSDDQKNGSYSC